jgi:DNA-directed RNA polymerase specialized sigma24 family protein
MVGQSTFADGQFEAQRGRLFAILGSASDAEDAVQDAYCAGARRPMSALLRPTSCGW